MFRSGRALSGSPMDKDIENRAEIEMSSSLSLHVLYLIFFLIGESELALSFLS